MDTPESDLAVAAPVWESLWGREVPTFTYLAGPAGSGKTFQTKLWAESVGKVALQLTGTTGIAAINLGGSTINSLLGYFDTADLQAKFVQGRLTGQLRRLYGAGLRRLVIDEVSMLDGDQLTYLVRAIEEVNGRDYFSEESERMERPELGLTLTGDFAQLPPVKAIYAFESPEWVRFRETTHTLTEIRRQADPGFIQALRAARRGEGRVAIEFFRDRLTLQGDDQFDGTTLFAKNDAVDRFNQLRLDKLPAPLVLYPSTRWGKQRSEWGNPEKAPYTWGIPQRLPLKVGAWVMILTNVWLPGWPKRAYYVNGDCGEITEANPEDKFVKVRLQRTGEEVSVDYCHREVIVPAEASRRRELRAEGLSERITEDGKSEILGAIDYMPLRLAWASTVHKCVAAGTRVPLLGRGYVPIEDVKIGDISPYGEIRGLAKSERRAVRVTTKRGYTVVCSPEHRWFTRRGFVSTELLTTEDEIQLQHGVPFNGAGSITPSEAWLLGALVGDGCYTDREEGQIHFACVNPQLGTKFQDVATSLYGIAVAWRKDRRGLYWTSKKTRAHLERLGLDYVKAPVKRVPHTIWGEGPRERAWFLRGLFDTDGSVGRNRVVLTTASERMSEDVQELLLTLGIVSKRTSYASGYKERGARYWQVWVGAENIDLLATTVSFFHEEKRKKLAACTPNRALRPALGYDRVVDVLDLGVIVPMYDVEVPEPHKIALGPFVGHNSQGLSLDRVQMNIMDPFFKSHGMSYVALSRARTAEGLRIVGRPETFIERCAADPKLHEWL